MIDFHSHILPAIDDGSQSVEQTLQMLHNAWSQGVRSIVATPHFYADEMVPETFLENREKAFAQLPLDEASMPSVYLGAEVAYFGSISRSDALQQLQIGNSGLLLVEMPFVPWSDRIIDDICLLQDRQGLTPVLAHVERYRDKSQFPYYCDKLLEAGVLFQCNAGAFLRWNTKGWALKQLKNGYVHFLGSDCHNMTTRSPNLGDAAALICKKLGQFALDEIQDFSAQMLGIEK